MIRSKISLLLLILCLAGSWLFNSCSKLEDDSDYTFSGSCDFSRYDSRQLNRQETTLHFTDSIGNLKEGEYRFVLDNAQLGPLVICNVPEDLEMEKGASVPVRFSGRIPINPGNEFWIWTDVELSYLELR